VAAELKRRLGLAIQDRSMEAVVEQSLEIGWTRDVFDRMIVAQATLDGAVLVTTDRTIRKNYPKAVW
jgi:PIN domain nuclease of toxin-antitoxin system